MKKIIVRQNEKFSCAGTIIYENNTAKVYLSCGDVYKTEGYDEINND